MKLQSLTEPMVMYVSGFGGEPGPSSYNWVSSDDGVINIFPDDPNYGKVLITPTPHNILRSMM